MSNLRSKEEEPTETEAGDEAQAMAANPRIISANTQTNQENSIATSTGRIQTIALTTAPKRKNLRENEAGKNAQKLFRHTSWAPQPPLPTFAPNPSFNYQPYPMP
jgi:hypothetical protein